MNLFTLLQNYSSRFLFMLEYRSHTAQNARYFLWMRFFYEQRILLPFIMTFNKIIWISEQPPRADKSAMGAINRPLRRAGLFG
jgi:hypothetical protein